MLLLQTKLYCLKPVSRLNVVNYCQKCGGKNIKNGLTFFPQKSSNFFFKQKTAYEMQRGLVGSEMCIRDRSTIVTYNFCMIPHSLIFSFILAHFGLRQNPTGLQEAIQGSDKTSKTTLIIKSTLERSFLMKKTPKNHFWNIVLFTRFNLGISLIW